MICAIHQANYLPWIGYFHKIYKSNKFVFLDIVEYTRGSFINRNKIKTQTGEIWLTIPIIGTSHNNINETKIDNSKLWGKKHWKSIEMNYIKAKYFYQISDFLKEIYETSWENLSDLNIHLIKHFSALMDFKTEFVMASNLKCTGAGTDLLVSICKELKADTYLSGVGAKKYLHEDLFFQEGIELIYQTIEHPHYSQRFGEFVPNLSIIDLILNEGIEKSKEIILNL